MQLPLRDVAVCLTYGTAYGVGLEHQYGVTIDFSLFVVLDVYGREGLGIVCEPPVDGAARVHVVEESVAADNMASYAVKELVGVAVHADERHRVGLLEECVFLHALVVAGLCLFVQEV